MHDIQISFILENQVRCNALKSITNFVHNQTRIETTWSSQTDARTTLDNTASRKGQGRLKPMN